MCHNMSLTLVRHLSHCASQMFWLVSQRLSLKAMCSVMCSSVLRRQRSWSAFQCFLLSCVPAFPASPTHRDLGAGSFVSRLFQSVVELIEAIRTRQTGSFPANKRDDSQHECQVGNSRCSCHQLIRMLTATIPALQHRTCNFD